MSIIARKVEIDFTDEKISPSAGSIFLSAMASRMGLANQIRNQLCACIGCLTPPTALRRLDDRLLSSQKNFIIDP